MPELPDITDPDDFHFRSYLFTVRLWLEQLGNGRTEWRGKAQHVMSGQARYFRDWPALIAFIEKMLPDPNAEGQERPPMVSKDQSE